MLAAGTGLAPVGSVIGHMLCVSVWPCVDVSCWYGPSSNGFYHSSNLVRRGGGNLGHFALQLSTHGRRPAQVTTHRMARLLELSCPLHTQ